MVPNDDQTPLVMVVTAGVVAMFWLPAAVAVVVPELSVTVAPDEVDARTALPVSLVGACEAFMPMENVGLVPAVMEYMPWHCHDQVLATAGSENEQTAVGDVESVMFDVGLQVFQRIRPDSSPAPPLPIAITSAAARETPVSADAVESEFVFENWKA
jgi:hypothetical protein